jgi:hypothetical protein
MSNNKESQINKTACQVAGQSPSGAMLKPGDTIDGMSLTTGAANAPPLWAFCSQAQYVGNTTTSDCNVPVVPRLAIGHILIPGDDTLTRLDWSEISWELTIDGQPLDLKSFGTYDFVLPAMSHDPSPVREFFAQFTARDVVLMDLSPGEHIIQGLAQMGSDSHTWVIHLTIEGDDLGTGTSWAGRESQNSWRQETILIFIIRAPIQISPFP